MQATDTTARQAHADAVSIDAAAKRRLADEYDAAQERGEVASGSVRTDIVPDGNDVRPATTAELGLTRKQIHEARMIRDAEAADPGVIERTANELVNAGKEPTKAAVAIITLITKPHMQRRAAGQLVHIDKFEGWLDGEMIVTSKQPRLDGARELLRRGYSPDALRQREPTTAATTVGFRPPSAN